jgi:hypothetical protein
MAAGHDDDDDDDDDVLIGSKGTFIFLPCPNPPFPLPPPENNS